MSNEQAKAGGEYGLNGEWYEGGQFLPSSPDTIKGELKTKKGNGNRKEKVDRYTWEISPTDTARPIYGLISAVTKNNQDTDKIERFEPAIAHYGEEFNGWHIDELIADFNNGQRWYEPR